MRFALYEGEIVDIDGCLSQLSVIKYTEEMCLKYVRGLKEIENFLRKSYGSLIYSCHTRPIKSSWQDALCRDKSPVPRYADVPLLKSQPILPLLQWLISMI